MTYDPFRDLSLPLPPSKYSYSYYSEDRVTLDDCLELFIQPQVLSGDEAWHCPKCNGRRVAEKQISLSRLPEILILTLKRFLSHGPYSRTKIYREIDFPLRLVVLFYRKVVLLLKIINDYFFYADIWTCCRIWLRMR